MPLRPSISEPFPTGDKPALIVLLSQDPVPAELRGLMVIGRAQRHAVQGIILDGRGSTTAWRGRVREFNESHGYCVRRGVRLPGLVVNARTIDTASAEALEDAINEVARLSNDGTTRSVILV